MLFRNQKAMRSGSWKYLSVDGDEFLFDLSQDERERANYGKREPKHPDATYSVLATKADLAHPS